MKFVFLMTHLNSGSNYLYESLNQLKIINCNHTDKIYTHPTDLDSLKNRYTKIFIDIIEFNHHFTSTAFYDFSQFIYLIRNPKDINYNYYLFRLRRMYEIAYHNGGLFLTYNDLFKEESRKRISDFLGIKEIPKIEGNADEEMDWGYKKYLTMFRKLKINMI